MSGFGLSLDKILDLKLKNFFTRSFELFLLTVQQVPIGRGDVPQYNTVYVYCVFLAFSNNLSSRDMIKM